MSKNDKKNLKRDKLLGEANDLLSKTKEGLDVLVERYRKHVQTRKEFKGDEALQQVSEIADNLDTVAQKIKQARQIRQEMEKEAGNPANSNNPEGVSPEQSLKDEFDNLEEARKKLEQAFEEEQQKQKAQDRDQDQGDDNQGQDQDNKDQQQQNSSQNQKSDQQKAKDKLDKAQKNLQDQSQEQDQNGDDDGDSGADSESDSEADNGQEGDQQGQDGQEGNAQNPSKNQQGKKEQGKNQDRNGDDGDQSGEGAEGAEGSDGESGNNSGDQDSLSDAQQNVNDASDKMQQAKQCMNQQQQDQQQQNQQGQKGQQQEQQQEQQQSEGQQGEGDQQSDADDRDAESGEGSSDQKQSKDKSQDKNNKDKEKKSDKSDGDGQGEDRGEEQEKSQGGDGQEKGKNDKEKTVDVDDVGDMPDVDETGETPEEQAAKEAGQDGKDQDGEGEGEGDEGQTADDLMDDIADMESDGDANSDVAKPNDNQQKSDKGGKSDFSKLPIIQDSWLDYAKNKALLAPYIDAVARMLKKIKEKQVDRKLLLAKQLELLPKGGDMKRLNFKSHRDLIVKKHTGQNIKEKDLERFHQDRKENVPTKVDLILLIDGSGSMTTGGRPNYMDAALTGAAIIREAAKKLGDFNIYVGIWGSKNVHWIGMPKMTDKEIGAGFESARKGLNCGTELNPAIVETARMLSNDVTKKGKKSGYSHIMVISDGDVDYNDKPKMTDSIQVLLNESPETTVDFIVVKGPAHNGQTTQMEDAAKNIVFKRKTQEISITRESDSKKFPLEIIKLLFKKVDKAKSFIAVSNNKKRNRYRIAHNRMRHK